MSLALAPASGSVRRWFRLCEASSRCLPRSARRFRDRPPGPSCAGFPVVPAEAFPVGPRIPARLPAAEAAIPPHHPARVLRRRSSFVPWAAQAGKSGLPMRFRCIPEGPLRAPASCRKSSTNLSSLQIVRPSVSKRFSPFRQVETAPEMRFAQALQDRLIHFPPIQRWTTVDNHCALAKDRAKRSCPSQRL